MLRSFFRNPLSISACLILLVFSGFFKFFDNQAHAATPPDFVGRSGRTLVLNGQPYKFTGLNIYNANSNGNNCWYNLASGTGLDTALNDIDTGASGKAKVFRAWFFQHMSTNNGVRDWTAFDHTLSVAKAHGYKVIATLGNQWADCDGPWTSYAVGYKAEQWYATDYKTTKGTAPGLPQTYRDYVVAVVNRYKNDPTILFWQLINEAEDKARFNDSTCSSTAMITLRAFADDMGSIVKSNDPNHLLSIGTIGSGQCGAVNTDYQDLHASPNIDLCEYHDYGKTTEPIPGDQWNGFQMRINQCNALNKPLFIGEVGIGTDEQVVNGNLQTRANYFDQKLSTQFGAGIAGGLIWDWRNGAYGGSSTRLYNPTAGVQGYEVGPGDPALAILGKYGLGGATITPTLNPSPTILTPTPTSAPTPSATISPIPSLTPTPDTTPPTVTITNPLNNALISRSSTITISANAADNVAVMRVEFYANNNLVCTDLTSQYSCSWRVPGKPNASYVLKVIAFDAAGNSTPTSITVTAR
ncbi:MAG TPA: Ig-like domain-containing protein [Candidatus Limnocylindrales bacterium]|nr:Ig-like domain-containing protein [Candidatus Limnocylindrales bacterium]